MDLKRIFAERIGFVYGPSGSGKTVLVSEIVRQFADEGRRVVWISFNESRDVLVGMWKSFGWDVGRIAVYDFPFVPQYRETLFNQVVGLAYKEKAEVLVVDGVDAIVSDRATADALSKVGLYSTIGIDTKYNPLADIADTIVRTSIKFIQSAAIRRLEIVKARGMEVATPVYYLAILPQGPVLLSRHPRHEPTHKIAAPGHLANLVGEIYKGVQIALYGPYQGVSAQVVDVAGAVAYVHKPYQRDFFKRARTHLVSPQEHLRLEHYAVKHDADYVIVLGAEKVPKFFREFRQPDVVWIDVYTTPPPMSDYDYVFYISHETIRLEKSPAPTAVVELPIASE